MPRDDGSRDEQAKSDAIRISAQAGGVPHERLKDRVLKFRRDRHAAPVVDLQHDIFGQAVRLQRDGTPDAVLNGVPDEIGQHLSKPVAVPFTAKIALDVNSTMPPGWAA